MVDPLFFGRVLPGGLLVLDKSRDYARFVRSFAGKYVELTLRKRRTKRSNAQNRWLFGVAYEVILEHCGYDVHERREMKLAFHYEMVKRCFGARHDDRLNVDVPNARSSQLSTAQFSEYMEWLVRQWAEVGCVIPLPNEVDLSKVEDWEAA